MDRRVLLDRLASDEEDRLMLAQFLDKSAQCRRSGIPTATAFLNPRQQTLAKTLANQTECTSYVFFGAYPEAERCTAIFLPDWAEPEQAEEYAPLQVLRAVWPAQAKVSLSHRDFLGALMASGVRRDAVGDILVRPDACDLIVLESIAPFLLDTFGSVGRTSIRVSRIAPDELLLPQRKIRLIRDTVASLRLDAVAATGFSMSRERARELIRTGHTIVNNLPCEKPDRSIREGDVISARGFGKFRVCAAGNLSRKGRIWVEIERFE